MTKNKKNARPDVAASERAKEPGAAYRQTTNSIHDDTTSTPPGQAGIIAALLSHGADHGLHLSDLARLTDLSERDVRRQIAAKRKRGIMILADNKSGYHTTKGAG